MGGKGSYQPALREVGEEKQHQERRWGQRAVLHELGRPGHGSMLIERSWKRG
jgi:hypothetical protein